MRAGVQQSCGIAKSAGDVCSLSVLSALLCVEELCQSRELRRERHL